MTPFGKRLEMCTSWSLSNPECRFLSICCYVISICYIRLGHLLDFAGHRSFFTGKNTAPASFIFGLDP